jgi:hypothetical protein
MGYLKHLRPCARDCDCKPGPCDACCPSIVSVQCRSRSASKSKCGFDEYGTPSSPPKKYFSRYADGTITIENWDSSGCTGDCLSKYTFAHSGMTGCSYWPSCGLTPGGSVTETQYAPCDTQTFQQTDTVCEINLPIDADVTHAVTSSTTRTATGNGCANHGGSSTNTTGVVTETLLDEYTTTQLHNDTSAAVAAASWSSYGATCPTALTTYSADELTITMRNAGYKFTFSAMTGTGCKLVFDILLADDSPSGSYCVNLPAGISEYEHELMHPGVPNTAIKLANWSIQTGAC